MSGKCKLLDSDNYANAAGMTRPITKRHGYARGTLHRTVGTRRWKIYANTVFSSVTRETDETHSVSNFTDTRLCNGNIDKSNEK